MNDARPAAIHHPAESELFDETLSCEVALPAEFRLGSAVIRPGTAETLLRSVALVEDARSDDGHDDRGESSAQMQRLTEANLHNDPEALRESLELLGEIDAAWNAIPRDQRVPAQAAL